MASKNAQYVFGSPAEKPVLRPLRQPLYDCEGWLAGAANTAGFNLFSNNTVFATAALGAKNASHTNMPGAGQLGTPIEFDLIGFTGQLQWGVDIDEFNQFMNRGVFTWTFGTTTVWLTTKLTTIPQGIAPVGFTTVPGTTIIANGTQNQQNFYNMVSTDKRARKILSNEQFRNRISHPAGITPINTLFWWTFLQGIYYAQL